MKTLKPSFPKVLHPDGKRTLKHPVGMCLVLKPEQERQEGQLLRSRSTSTLTAAAEKQTAAFSVLRCWGGLDILQTTTGTAHRCLMHTAYVREVSPSGRPLCAPARGCEGCCSLGQCGLHAGDFTCRVHHKRCSDGASACAHDELCAHIL